MDAAAHANILASLPAASRNDAACPDSGRRKRSRSCEEEEAFKRIRWSEDLLSRRPPRPPVPPAIEPPPSVQGQRRNFVCEEEVTPSHSEDNFAGVASADPLVMSPPCLGRSASVVAAATTLLVASREGGAQAEDVDTVPRRRLEMHTSPVRPANHVTKPSRARKVRPVQDGPDGASQTYMQLGGVRVATLSKANDTMLRLLAATFRLCPSPSSAQLRAIAHRLNMRPEQLTTWFESRRTLQAWVTHQSIRDPAVIGRLFYPELAERVDVPEDTGTAC